MAQNTKDFSDIPGAKFPHSFFGLDFQGFWAWSFDWGDLASGLSINENGLILKDVSTELLGLQ